MAALSRNSSRTLLRFSLHQWRSFTTTSPAHPSHLLPSLSGRSLPFLNSVRDQKFNTFGFYERFFCTASSSSSPSGGSSSSAAAAKNSEVKNSNGDKSNDGGNSQGSQQSGDAGKSVRGSPVSWMSLFLLLITGAGIVYYYDNEKKRHIEEISNASNAVRQGPSVGQAAIGGPFNLVNHEGKKVTERDFLGKWTVLYFGFTHCPDICPDELQKLASAVDKIKEKSGIEIVPVFISVDPERDTVEQVSEYVKEFHPKLIGLTGDPEEIRKVARAYRVYYMKTTEEGSDYLVDHSIVMYLMSPDMKFVKFFGKNNDVDGLTKGMIKEIKQYKK
ncbi:protein SCO1 homolog 1, mitochondrial-like [Chenopodium quinoa]|uniref:protein SCO1 homolog 1, mitochondrial-like n=1 Tax=Chenopodium quinoa TaxID=63459 RepID=UPI000B76BDD6|nr:protein SCO1 homolog 1, mitochondrial-like [Chenopodium quinoa]